jgi:hypothetical protein
MKERNRYGAVRLRRAMIVEVTRWQKLMAEDPKFGLESCRRDENSLPLSKRGS